MRRSSSIVLPTHGSVSHRYIDITDTVSRVLTLLVTDSSDCCVTDYEMQLDDCRGEIDSVPHQDYDRRLLEPPPHL